MNDTQHTTSRVLAGIRVLDFGRFVAAPWCSAVLADMGADVIRVEKRDGGEDRWVQAVTASGEGGMFLQCNRNKRSLTLDTTTVEGTEIIRQLVASADVVVANMPPAAMRSSRLDYESLQAVREDIILASATTYGEGGPYSDRIGFDGTGQVLSGATFRQGLPDLPIRSSVPYVDFATAMGLAVGVMMALFHRNQTGEGQHVEGALLPTALMMSNGLLIERDVLGVERARIANRGYAVAPCDLYEAKDGWFLLQVVGQPMFKRWCRMVGREDLFEDPRFASDDLRAEHGDVLNDVMQEWCKHMTRAELMASADAAKLPAAPLASPGEVLEDPHVEAMGYLQRIDFPGAARPVPIIETPFRMSKTPGAITTRAPMLGEHTDEILGEIGYDADEIAELRSREIV
jgi:crotonobetainyl-CoA:carnitine CoA-transferase CaiB-like acyl-CoA transferase